MSKLSIPSILIAIFLLTACSVTKEPATGSATVTPRTETALPTITSTYFTLSRLTQTSTLTLPPTLVEPTSTLKIIPTPTPTDTPQVVNILKEQCREIFSILPVDANPQGVLVFSSPDGLSLRDFNTKKQREIPGLINYPATSPDGKWLAYTIIPEDQSKRLMVESADGLKNYQTPTGQGWLAFDRGFWLDNQRLWFSVFPLPGHVAPVVVFNPFTDEQQELQSDYPGVMTYQVGFSSGAGLHFGYHSVVIDPSLNLVIYPQFDEKEGYLISLWDRQSQKVLVSLLDGGDYGHLPLWLPDGSQFVVVAKPKKNSPKEWFVVSRDGQQIRQLTHFGEQFPNFEIQNNASVSPNGRYLAFGLSLPTTGSNVIGNGNLIILDLETFIAVNTCIPIWDYGVSVWSPDSHYLVVGAPWANDDKTANPIIMLDMEHGWAAQVAEGWNFSPVGWMVSP